MESQMNYSLVNTAHNIGKANRSFRGNSSPTSTHSFARRLDAKQLALEDWESSFSQILSRYDIVRFTITLNIYPYLYTISTLNLNQERNKTSSKSMRDMDHHMVRVPVVATIIHE